MPSCKPVIPGRWCRRGDGDRGRVVKRLAGVGAASDGGVNRVNDAADGVGFLGVKQRRASQTENENWQPERRTPAFYCAIATFRC